MIYTHLNEFWQFVYERQEIWYRRFVLKLPKEKWYEGLNPLFRKQKFCNVYPELDRGSIFITKKTENCSTKEKIMKIVIYRLFNSIETYEIIEDLLKSTTWDPDKVIDRLNKMKNEGKKIFGGAFMQTGVGSFKTSSVKHVSYIRDAIVPFVNQLDSYSMRIEQASGLAQIHEILRELNNIGPFLAFVIIQDFVRCRVTKYDMDSWFDISNVPGARKGLRIIFGNDRESHIYELRDMADAEFKRMGLDFKYPNGKKLGLLECENCLCEFQKFYALAYPSEGLHGKNRRFVPTSENTLYD